jgi:hypothetical protein
MTADIHTTVTQFMIMTIVANDQVQHTSVVKNFLSSARLVGYGMKRPFLFGFDLS